MREDGLAVSGLCIKYNDDTIFTNLNASFKPGTITTIIGPNGCGKSSVLKTMGQLLKPHCGRVVIDGKSIQSLPRKQFAKRVASLTQSPLIPDGFTVKELIALGRFSHQNLLGRQNEQDKALIKFAIDEMSLHDFIERPVNSLSGGQRQRAWIAMTLAQDAPYILLDEPTTYLDVAHQIEILSLLEHLNQEHDKTIVMVLHDINQAIRFSHQLIVMANGKVLATGAPCDVINESIMEEAFGLKVNIMQDPATGLPHVIPVASLIDKHL